jgi:hypothetical protein
MYENILQGFHEIKNFLLSSTLDKNYRIALWNEYFSSLFKFITNPKLNPSSWNVFQKEKFSETSFRENGIKIFSEIWNSIGELQKDFVPILIEYVLPLFQLVNDDDINHIIVDVYFGVLWREYAETATLKESEGSTQRCIVSSNMSPTTTTRFIHMFEIFFINFRLTIKFESDEQLKEAGNQFIERLKELLLCIKDVHRFKDKDEELKTDACIKVMVIN